MLQIRADTVKVSGYLPQLCHVLGGGSGESPQWARLWVTQTVQVLHDVG